MAIVVLLAGCSSTVLTGTGRVAAESRILPAGDSSVQREVFTTRVGDPVTADFCGAVPYAMQTGGYTVHPHGWQELAGCSYDVVPDPKYLHDVPGFDVYVILRDAMAFAALRHGPVVYVHQQRTWSPLYNGQSCVAFVLLAPYVLETYSRSREDEGAPTRQRACTVVHDVNVRMAAAIAGGRLPRRPVSHRTVAAIDFCKTLSDRKAARLVGSYYASNQSLDAGSGCEWNVGYETLYVFVRTIDNGYDPDGTPVHVRGHLLFKFADDDPAHGCNADSHQGQIPAVGKMEVVIVRLESQLRRGSLCSDAERAAVAVLDGAGLN